MVSDYLSLSPLNLALDGSLDLFVDLYDFTYNVYLNKLRENPSLVKDRSSFNSLVIPEILPEFEFLAFKHLRIFTTKINKIHLQSHHFNRFDFFDEEKIKHYDWKVRLEKDWIRLGFKSLEDNNKSKQNKSLEESEFQETAIDLNEFLDQFMRVMMRAIRDEIQKSNPLYSIFDARKDIEQRIAERMQMRRVECLISNSEDFPPTEEPLYLYSALNGISCKANQHSIISKKYYARHMDGKRTVVLPTHYCETCKRYMIGALSLSFFKEFCGDFVIETYRMEFDGDNIWNLASESKLHKLGYNVIDGKLSVNERHSILISILESKKLTFFEIVATIEQNIRMFSKNGRMQKAVEKWRNDLVFINEYVLNK